MNQYGSSLIIEAPPPPPSKYPLMLILFFCGILHVGERIGEKQYRSTMIIEGPPGPTNKIKNMFIFVIVLSQVCDEMFLTKTWCEIDLKCLWGLIYIIYKNYV